MTQPEWEQLEAAVSRMTPAERDRLRALLESESPPGSETSVLGLFSEEAELVDAVVAEVHVARENHSLRLAEDG